MWHDIEAEIDLLNFGTVAHAAADLIRSAKGTPLTIGVSGGWGTGKSTLVKLVKTDLQANGAMQGKQPAYLLMEFNAWLYQGYEDARQSLLQSVSDRLLEEAKKRRTLVDKALEFGKRVKLLKLGRLAAPVLTHVAVGTVAAGPLGALFGAATGLVQSIGDADKLEENLKAVQAAYGELHPELQGLLKEKKEDSLPKEIEALRAAFVELLEGLDVTLVVFVDDLDRCLPDTAIATLEAMRLLLHVKRTAFVIAADESMIRGAVRAHFKGVDIEEGLVTSYFDKLIQVPLRVPRLGVNEVKGYLTLLLTELAARQGRLSAQAQIQGQEAVLKLLKASWGSGISREALDVAFGDAKHAVAKELDIADQLASLLVSASDIAGNPRLIKRFLNQLMIRLTMAQAMQMPLAIEALVKVQLLERCASSAAFEFFTKAVATGEDGRAEFMATAENAAAAGEPYAAPDLSWKDPFFEQWIKLAPRLAREDLRPLLHLSRDRSLGLAAYDELLPQAKQLLEAALSATEISKALVGRLAALGESEASRVLTRVIRRSRENHWAVEDVLRCLNFTEAHPALSAYLLPALAEIPGAKRDVAVLPILKSKPWAAELLQLWAHDPATPEVSRKYLGKAGK